MFKSQLLCQLSYAPACVGILQKSDTIIAPGIWGAKGSRANSIAKFHLDPQAKRQVRLLDLNELALINRRRGRLPGLRRAPKIEVRDLMNA